MRKPIFKQAQMTADNDIYRGESIESYCNRCTQTKQPVEGGAPIIFTARKDGVLAEYNIRTDRFEIAQNAMEKAAMSYQAKRADYINPKQEKQTEQTEETTEETA